MFHKRTLIILISVLLGSIIFIATHSCRLSHPDNTDVATQNNTINVVIEHSPLSYSVDDDSITGFDYELLQMIAQHAGVDINIHPEVSISKSLSQLNNRTYDVAAYHLPITSENKQNYIFTKPLLLNKYVLVQRTDSTSITKQLDLGGCTVHIIQDTPIRMRIENLAHEIGKPITICEMHDYETGRLIEMVATGEIDYAICDEASATILTATYDNIDYSLDISFTQMMSWALHPESIALRDSLNTWLQQIQETNEYKSLYTRYFGTSNFNKHLHIADAADNANNSL